MAETTHFGEGQLETNHNEEIVFNNGSYMPSLKQFLSDFNIPEDVYLKLKSESIDWNTLIHIENDELGILCNQVLNLQFTIKIKFKAAIKQLQLQYKPKPQQQQRVVHITMNEQQELNKITASLKRANDIQTLFENHLKQVQNHVNTMKSNIDKEFEQISHQIQKRKQLLHKNIDEWKLKKLEYLNHEITNVIKYKQGIDSVQIECKQLLKNNIKMRENKIKAMTLQIFDNGQYDNINILEYIETNTKLIDIKLEPKLLINNVKTHGQILENVQNPLCILPVINLCEAIKVASEYQNGYKIRLKWNVSIPQNNIKNFIIKYKENVDNNNEDEKKVIFDEKGGEDEWIITDYKLIKMNDNHNQFEVDIINKFEYNQHYKYQILLQINKPIDSIVKSNIFDSMITNIVKLKLNSCGHRAHYFSEDNIYHPQQMLNSNAQGYGSAFVHDFKPNENDWVVFKLEEDGFYIPKKYVIKCFGNAQSVKTMRMFIGNGMKWYSFNPKSINVEKNNKYQTFEINGVDQTVIKTNELIYIKLEFIANHGCKSGCKFFIYEFQLYGIKLE